MHQDPIPGVLWLDQLWNFFLYIFKFVHLAGFWAVSEEFFLLFETGLARLDLALLGTPRVREIHIVPYSTGVSLLRWA